jgi:hypothetical protein
MCYYLNDINLVHSLSQKKRKTKSMSINTEKQRFPAIWPGGSELRLVNRDTFDPTTSMNLLAWGGVTPITSGTAIRERQDTLKVLMASKELQKFFRKERFSNLNEYGRRFFINHGSNSKFIKDTEQLHVHLAEAVEKVRGTLTTDLYDRINATLTHDLAAAKVAEDNLVQTLTPELEKIYSYTGTAKYRNRFIEGKRSVASNVTGYGYRDYAFREINNKVIRAAKHLIAFMSADYKKESKSFRGLMLLVKALALFPYLVAAGIMSFVEKYQNDVLYTKTIPTGVIEELGTLNDEFYSCVMECFKKSLAKLHIGDSLIKQVDSAVIVTTEFQYALNSKGFRVRMIDAHVSFNRNYDFTEDYLTRDERGQLLENLYTESAEFKAGVSWYSAIQHFLIAWQVKSLVSGAARKALLLPLRVAFEQALAESKSLLGNGENTFLRNNSSRSHKYETLLDEVKFVNVQNAIHGMNLVEDMARISRFRSDVITLVNELSSCAGLVARIISAKEQYANLPFCFPTVLADDKNMVTFDNLAPIHLIGRTDPSGTKEIGAKDLRLIAGLPALNGRIVSITGQNGGGKTATEVELINSLYQAHAGLPVFAQHFSFNPKDVVAMVFVERGSGSMLELLMKKLAVIAEEVKNNPTNKIVVVIDELLTGTQEDVGYEIGQQYLNMLASKNCSVMFVTQITGLAQYAEQKLNAISYYFDQKGNLVPGIGKGNAQYLAQQVGLDKYLVTS